MAKGGYREGAGRKKIIENSSEKEQKLIKEKASQSNMSTAEYIRQAVLDKINN